MTTRIYNTSVGSIVPLEVGSHVKMYTCGITPYDAAHLGHAAVYLTFDILQRRLRDQGVSTQCVRNVTDVDDDILRKARELNCHYLDLAASEMAKFDRDMNALGLIPASSEPRATSAISEILTMVDSLMRSGHAYLSDGYVYFDVTTSSGLGAIGHYSMDEMLTFAAERGGNPSDKRKRHPLDFVLWQPSLDDEPAWDSLWGPGRPGWHIECSALVRRELGDTIDIHGGGSDLIFPHHECEAMQSEAVTGLPFSRYWMHVGMVRLDGVKMSKSLGNLVFVGDLVEKWDPSVVRLAIVRHHYRSSWDWRDSDLSEAQELLDRWRRAGAGDAALTEARAALDDDLNVATAVEAIDSEARRGRGVSSAAELLGLSMVAS